MNNDKEEGLSSRKMPAARARLIGSLLPAAGIVAATLLCFLNKMRIPVENPQVLVLASIFLLIRFKSISLLRLQKLTAFYLVAVSVNELTLQNFQVSLFASRISVPYSVLPLLFFAAGYLFGGKHSTGKQSDFEDKNFVSGWVMAFIIIAGQMIVLYFLLRNFYGFGYQCDLKVLGTLCQYFLLFIFLWKDLHIAFVRRTAALIPPAFLFSSFL